MKKRLFILNFIMLLLIFMTPFLNIHAEEYLSDKSETNYNSNNGLLTGKANTICQTEDGYIWIGQYAGLTRYDSKEFITITNYNDINLTSIVALAAKGNYLLIGSEKGFFVKNEKNEIKRVKTDDVNLVVKDIQVYNDLILVGTASGLYKYDEKLDMIERINSKNISRITIKDESNYYYLEGKTTVYFNKQTDPLVNASIKSIFYYQNKLYIGTRSGSIMIYELDELGFVKKDSSNNPIHTVDAPIGLSTTINDIMVKDDLIYISADNGEYIGNKNAIGAIHQVKSYGEKYNKMEKSFFDYEGNLWLVSSSLGIYKISSNKITDYFFETDLVNNTTYAIEKYHGYTFIATDGGLYILDNNEKQIQPPADGNYSKLNEIDSYLNQLINIIGEHAVRDIEVFKDKIYFATYGTYGNLYSFDLNNIGTQNAVIEFLTYDNLSLNKYLNSSNEAKDFRCLRSTDNYLFIGLDRGVAKYDGENIEFIDTENIYPLYMTYNENDLYIVLNTIGVVKTSINNFGNFTRLDSLKQYSTLKCMYINGGILFSDNNELFFWKNNEIERINLDVVGSVVELAFINNKYYICSEANVYIVDDIFSDNKKIDILDSSNGLKSSLVANSSGYYDINAGEYYFTTSSGILKYNVNNDNDSLRTKRKISIDKIVVDGKNYSFDNQINLSSDLDNIVIDFSVLSYKSDQHYNIYYKLEGYDKNYQVLNSKDSFSISYKNISGGNYSFELYTEDLDGTRSANSISFNIIKDKRITEYEIFWVLIALVIGVVVIGIITLIYRHRIKKSVERQNELKDITIESIEAIARTIDVKDSYTNGHSIRVGHFSRIIAKKLGFSGDELENFYYTALLHDIGKIGIPDAILNKPGKLTDEEFEIMRSHTTKGAKILKDISTIPNIVEGAKYHHEKYGGGGYPEGLVGEDIPYIARIICCADCFDAMATRRTYKDPYPKEKIISEFERCSGTQFDPKIAKVVIELIESGELKVDENIK